MWPLERAGSHRRFVGSSAIAPPGCDVAGTFSRARLWVEYDTPVGQTHFWFFKTQFRCLPPEFELMRAVCLEHRQHDDHPNDVAPEQHHRANQQVADGHISHLSACLRMINGSARL